MKDIDHGIINYAPTVLLMVTCIHYGTSADIITTNVAWSAVYAHQAKPNTATINYTGLGATGGVGWYIFTTTQTQQLSTTPVLAPLAELDGTSSPQL
eukprot:1050210-Amphidinium_carterae.1